jgi:hypothetical protein
MKKDLRTVFREAQEKEDYSLKLGYKERFLERLEQELPKKQKISFYHLAIAASILLLVGSAIYFFATHKTGTDKINPIVDTQNGVQEVNAISLGDLSPDLKKIEQYYLATINFELAKLDVSGEYEELVKAYMEQLAALNKEYQELNKELNTIGPNDQTIAALIQNLQMRVELLQKLKKKLNELKQTNNETVINI